MKLKKIGKPISLIVAIVLATMNAIAADNAATYLIMNDISPYYRLTQTIDAYTHKLKSIPGYVIYNSPGVLAGADHFTLDHADMTYRTEYQSDELDIGMTVEVTQHAGSDSDKWLLHEVEDSYRDGDDADGRLGLLSGVGVKIREIGGNKFIYWGLGGGNYTWISGKKVVEIKYADLQRTKPEPLEVVQAYLQKHPSTIPSTLVLDKAHDSQWIKNEMDRRLWLCDKWFYQLQLAKVQQSEVFQQAVKSMTIFLDYREKYYGEKAAKEKNLLAGYLNTNNGTGIKAKLKEYKDWWAANKEKGINL